MQGWPPYFIAKNPRGFLRGLVAHCDLLLDWRVRSSELDDEECFVTLEHANSDASQQEAGRWGVGAVLSVYRDKVDTVQLTIHGTHGDNAYDSLERKAWAMIQGFARSVSISVRLLHPRTHRPKMTAGARAMFERFLKHTEDPWTGKRPQVLHPLDYPYFFWFIGHCSRYKLTISPDDVMQQLRCAGFAEEHVLELGRYYHIGREVLAGQWRPWQMPREVNKE